MSEPEQPKQSCGQCCHWCFSQHPMWLDYFPCDAHQAAQGFLSKSSDGEFCAFFEGTLAAIAKAKKGATA